MKSGGRPSVERAFRAVLYPENSGKNLEFARGERLGMDAVAKELQERTAGSRYVELDGLRGVAAFTVIWHHFWLMYSLPVNTRTLPLHAGREAVLVFFLLSGFVLSLPFWNKGGNGPYDRYLVRRFFRIYVPFAAAVAVALVADEFLGRRHLPLSWWYYRTWQQPVTGRLIRATLLMWPDAQVNTAFWSLRTEMQMSIIFPALLLLIRWLRLLPTVLLFGLLYGIGYWGLAKGWRNPHFVFDTLEYGSLFVVGALIARHRDLLRRWVEALPRILRLALVLAALLGYWSHQLRFLARLRLFAEWEVAVVAGGAGLIVCAMYVPEFRRILQSRPVEYLGRISYSLYLIHGTVLFALVNLFYWKIPVPWMAVVFLVVSIALAHLFCISVEEPALRIGKRLASRGKTQKRAGQIPANAGERETNQYRSRPIA